MPLKIAEHPDAQPDPADAMDAVLHCTSLPTLPAVAARVLELTADPDVTLPQVAALISTDQGLSAKLLRTVNSSFYGVRHKCATVNQAVALLGLGAVRCLSLGFALVGAIGDEADEDFDYASYWRRALVTALAARRIASARGLGVADEAFVSGLLQDIGMVAALRALGAPYARCVRSAGPHHRLATAELAAFGAQHAELGAALARKWGLPDELSVPIRYHERPSAAPAEYRRLAQCVALGNLVHDAICAGDEGQRQQAFAQQAERWLHLDDRACAEITRATAEAAAEAAKLLHLDTGSWPDVKSMLTAAERRRRQLAAQEVAAGRSPAPTGPDGLGALVRDGRLRDPLTGAVSRAEFECRLSSALEQAHGGSAPVTLVIAGIDQSELVRQARGQDIIDVALVECAHTLSHLLRPIGAGEVVVARWDEASMAAAMIGPDRAAATRLAVLATEELERLSAGWRGGDGQPAVTISLGLACADDASARAFRRVELLIHAATKAAEASQEAGGACLRTFTPRQAA